MSLSTQQIEKAKFAGQAIAHDELAIGKKVYSPKYELRSTASGYSVLREDGDYAEFLDSDEADEAMKLLISGEKSEDDYEWTN